MKIRRTTSALLTLLLLSGAALSTAGCADHREGPAERAGKKVDHAADKVGDAAEDTGRKINRSLPGS